VARAWTRLVRTLPGRPELVGRSPKRPQQHVGRDERVVGREPQLITGRDHRRGRGDACTPALHLLDERVIQDPLDLLGWIDRSRGGLGDRRRQAAELQVQRERLLECRCVQATLVQGVPSVGIISKVCCLFWQNTSKMRSLSRRLMPLRPGPGSARSAARRGLRPDRSGRCGLGDGPPGA
jgi:hypothetical protein